MNTRSKMKNISSTIITLIVLIEGLIVVQPGCRNQSINEYKSFNETFDRYQVIFEYPFDYGVQSEQQSNETLYIEIHKKQKLYPALYIDVKTSLDTTVEKINVLSEKYQDSFSTTPNVTNFNIVKDQTLSVSGVQAKFISYIFKYNENNKLNDQTGKYIVFVKDSMIWNIIGVSNEQDKDEFETLCTHFLDSLEIINSNN